MNLALKKSRPSSLDCLFQSLLDLIQEVIQSHSTYLTDVRLFLKIRHDRKDFEKQLETAVKDFFRTSIRQQADVEIVFYKAVNKLESLLPKAKEDISNEHGWPISYLVSRELDKILAIIKKHQKCMSDHLYPDRTNELLTDKKQYQALVAAWGDLANDEE